MSLLPCEECFSENIELGGGIKFVLTSLRINRYIQKYSCFDLSLWRKMNCECMDFYPNHVFFCLSVLSWVFDSQQ